MPRVQAAAEPDRCCLRRHADERAARLGQSETLAASVDQIKQVVTNGLDSTAIGSILTFNSGGKQADVLRQAQGDEKFKDTLS